MVNICGKCQYYTRTETTTDGYFYHYCSKVDELFPPEPQPDGAEPSETPTLKIKFNDTACQHYEINRR